MVKYATKAASDTAWEIAQIDTLSKLTFGFVGARNITSVVVDGAGNPWIAYSDEKLIKLAVWNGSAWEIGTLDRESCTVFTFTSVLGTYMRVDEDLTDPHSKLMKISS